MNIAEDNEVSHKNTNYGFCFRLGARDVAGRGGGERGGGGLMFCMS